MRSRRAGSGSSRRACDSGRSGRRRGRCPRRAPPRSRGSASGRDEPGDRASRRAARPAWRRARRPPAGARRRARRDRRARHHEHAGGSLWVAGRRACVKARAGVGGARRVRRAPAGRPSPSARRDRDDVGVECRRAGADRDLELHGAASLSRRGSSTLSSAPPRPPRRPTPKGPMSKTVILGTARTPFAKMGGALASKGAQELGGEAISAALERADVGPEPGPAGDLRPGAAGGPGPDPLAPGADRGRDPEGGPLGDDQQGLRLGHARDRARRPGGPRRRPRGRRHRRYGVDVERPLPAARCPLRLPDGRRHRGRRDDPRRAHEPLHRTSR